MRPGHELVVGGVAVVVDALHERGGAVADAHDGDADAAILGAAVAVAVAIAGHACSLECCSRSASCLWTEKMRCATVPLARTASSAMP